MADMQHLSFLSATIHGNIAMYIVVFDDSQLNSNL
jgi:hypothetical protein